MAYKVDEIVYVELGQMGENDVKEIDIDVTAWLEKWPAAHYFIIAQRPGDTHPYPVATTLHDGILTWHVKVADVSIQGVGHAEVRAVELKGTDLDAGLMTLDDNAANVGVYDTPVKISKTFRTMVDKSISSPEIGAEDLLKGYINQLIERAAEVLSGSMVLSESTPGEVSMQIAAGEHDQKSTQLTKLKLPAESEFREIVDSSARSSINDINTRLGSHISGALTIRSVVDTLMPVGYVYMSITNRNPGEFLGGTWVPITGRYFYAADSNHAAGAAGGSSTVSYTPAGSVASGGSGTTSQASGNTGSTTLNTNQIPKHTHGFRDYWNTSWDGSANQRQAVAANGQNAGLDSSASRTYAYTLENSSSQQGHTHSLGGHTHTVGGHTHTFTGAKADITIDPPWYGVYAWRRTR